MSKEATGKNGAVLGSSEYWYYVNHATIFDRLMRNTSDINYRETLSEVGNRAGSAVEEIYDDLQDHIKYVSAIPSDNRSALATQVEALYNVCNMAGGFCSHSSECIGILNLSSFYLPSTSFRDERAIQDAIRKIENCSALVAKAGAAAGAAIGSAFPVIGTAVGGAIGGILGGIGGSYLGGSLGELAVDITWLER